MNLDELQSVQARERQSSDLQHLRASFYREVGEFVRELTDRRSALVEEAEDPFSSPEVRQLSDDIETAEQTVEAIYERRVGKVVKKASITAAGMPVDAEGLTAEEEALFDDLVARIEQNREDVLSVLDGDVPSGGDVDFESGSKFDSESGSGSTTGSDALADSGTDTPADAPDPSDQEGVSAADLMGSTDDDSDEASSQSDTSVPSESDRTEVQPESAPPGGQPSSDEPSSDEQPSSDGQSEPTSDERSESTSDADAEREGDAGPDPTGGDVPGLPRTTVRITADVGEVVGADDRDYDLGPEDVVTLPEPNADVLIEKDAAERLE